MSMNTPTEKLIEREIEKARKALKDSETQAEENERAAAGWRLSAKHARERIEDLERSLVTLRSS